MSKEAIEHYEAALKEAFPSGATGDVFHHWNEARKALAEQPAQPSKPLTDDQIRGLTPKPDGIAESDARRVEVLPGVMGTEFDEVDAWSMPLVLQIARAIEAAHGIK